MIRKSILQLECHRKLAYVMNTSQKNSFPEMETVHCMCNFFEGGHLYQKAKLPLPKFGLFCSKRSKCEIGWVAYILVLDPQKLKCNTQKVAQLQHC